ncbi:MAG: SAM-dependent methyltransferase, partial [Alphaproteobacteria bacterium]
VLSLGLKIGEGEGRDRLGRFYSYYTIEEIEALLAAAAFTLRDRDEGAGAGLSGEVSPWVVVRAHA